MVGQNTDGAPAEHAQEAKDHFALLVVAVGETFVITVAVHGMTRVNGTGRTIAAEAGLSNLHNAGGTITTWPARQAQRPEAQRLRRKSRASGQAGTRSTNQAPRNNVIRTMTRYHGGARHVTPIAIQFAKGQSLGTCDSGRNYATDNPIAAFVPACGQMLRV